MREREMNEWKGGVKHISIQVENMGVVAIPFLSSPRKRGSRDAINKKRCHAELVSASPCQENPKMIPAHPGLDPGPGPKVRDDSVVYYWIPAFAGMTPEGDHYKVPSHIK